MAVDARLDAPGRQVLGQDRWYRMRFIPEYLRTFTGEEPAAHELERFYQRNDFVPPCA